MQTFVLAHGSGIDEALGLLVPVLLVVGLWLWSRRRPPPEDDEPGAGPGAQ